RMHATGTHPALEAMRSEMPAGVLDLLTIPGLRPDRVVKLHRELGISSLEELEEAARADRIKTAKGLGASLQAKIVQGLEIRKRGHAQRQLHRAAALTESATANLRKSRLTLRRVAAAGEFRPRREPVSELARGA